MSLKEQEWIESEAQLESRLSEPTPEVIEAVGALEGDLLILGVGGKMGPTLAKQAKRAIDAAGVSKKVIGVSRFSVPGVQEMLDASGIETIAADLLTEDSLQNLPDVQNVIFMAGRKFGAMGNEPLTWAINTYLPGRVCEKFHSSRLVVFSTGNVYPLTPVSYGGATERYPVEAIGEYAQSCLGRERVFEYFSAEFGTRMAILRLNYAVELRYGILLDIAEQVYAESPILLTMGNVNVIWQGDATAVALRVFAHCQSPPLILNVTGPETVSIRSLAQRFRAFWASAASKPTNKELCFAGEESTTALLSNASQCHQLFGYPGVCLEQIVRWVAHWVQIGGPRLNKPTRFEVRDGKF